VQGAADPHFARLIRLFAQLFPGRRFGGGALSVYVEGRPVVDERIVSLFFPNV